jgi:hypothetical protein
MDLFTRNNPYCHLLKNLLFLPKHPAYGDRKLFMVIDVCDRTSTLGRIQEMLNHLSANVATVNFRVNFLIWRNGTAVLACTRAPPPLPNHQKGHAITVSWTLRCSYAFSLAFTTHIPPTSRSTSHIYPPWRWQMPWRKQQHIFTQRNKG